MIGFYDYIGLELYKNIISKLISKQLKTKNKDKMSDDKKITLYWNIGSQPSRALKALLIAGGVPHNDRHLDIMKGEHKTEEI